MTSERRPTLDVSGLEKVYRLGSFPHKVRIRALDRVDLHVESAEPAIISVVGESGSGKTTLAKVILRLVDATAGTASVYDLVVAGPGAKPSKSVFLRSVQPIFQNPFEAFSSYRTVDAYLYDTATRVAKYDRQDAIASMTDALRAVGLKYDDVKGKYPNQFSGGELQRISIARALIPRPRLIVADEPVSMIDASLRMNIVNLFRRLKLDYQTSFLYITHDLATAYYISDYIAVMYRGTIVEFGPARQVLGDPRHPYTRLLLDSIPRVGHKWERGTFAAADLEAKEFQLEGCKFRHRCPLAAEICERERPSAVRKEDGREVACHMA
ncbi:MAG TPA: ABC transporter ATP-binding protein [Actinopolymorphaceae bacterium]|jgi:peptide/nickel transport system ATP-binding protein